MRKKQELKLLVEMIQLLDKYGIETFQSLSKLISTSELNDCIYKMLSEVSVKFSTVQIKDEKKQKTANKTKSSIPISLIKSETESPEKYLILKELFDNLSAKTVLPSLRELKSFAEDNGLPEITIKSRKNAINSMINILAELPEDKLKEKFQKIIETKSKDRTLQGWSDVILNR
ncbi:MAG: hypothetical protein GY795_28660 [Desulfobacterales bacterium]|nr:hypothetical protein [Desulfobacterales bacterium]